MSYLTIMLFFAYSFCLGFTITFFAKKQDNFLERNLMRIGFGIAFLPFLGLILNLLRIPIDWRIILALSLAYPAFYLIKNRPKPKLQLKITKTDLSILAMLVLFSINLYIYASGAFTYPYLEDDDSWSHALGAKYVSIEKNVFPGAGNNFHYIEPYPPAYDLLLGLLHQTNDSVYWTLKFFNALIISLSTIFFYFFVKEFTGSRNKALFAAFALASIPAFMSHFIWALSLTVPLYFVVFYALEMAKHDKKWWIVAALSMVTVLTSSPTHSTYFGLFFALYIITKIVLERKLPGWHIAAGILGLALSFAVWWLPMISAYGFEGTLEGLGFSVGRLGELGIKKSLGGTGDRAYTFSDFFFAQKQNMINNPIGIGVVLSLLTLAGIIFLILKYKSLLKQESHWLVISLVWLFFTLYAVNADRFPIKLSPFRAWMLLAIPVCIFAAEGAHGILELSKKCAGRIGMYILLALLLTGIYFTSAQQKIAVNTATWPPGAFWSYAQDSSGRVYSPELQSYVWMRENLPKNSKVFTFANNGPVIGMDMHTCHWCKDVIDYQEQGFKKNAQENYNWLKNNGYGYIIIDGQTAKKFGANESNAKIQELGQSGMFRPALQNQGAIIFKI
ncbi:glycosyltransferase family 39 protein [Candidatus Woesearchaeota archaeon]|nr:glycosyltransferase family 39 protein [Candidatus Woesearchaeota archaeon]